MATDEVTHASVTVLLVNFRSLANIEARLRSGALRGCNVVIVDNGDDPTGITALCDTFGASSILLAQNVGFAAAVNAAVAAVGAVGRQWLVLNPDVALTTEQFAQLRGALTPGLDGVAPLLQGPDGRLQVGCAGGRLSLRSVVAYFLFVSHLIPRVRGVFLTRAQARKAHAVEWLCMACMLLAPDAFDRYGPIPEGELVYAEDLAWGTAASAKGARFRLVSDVVVRHDQGASGGSHRWIGAMERLCRARLGRFRGGCAILAIRFGLRLRRALGREIV